MWSPSEMKGTTFKKILEDSMSQCRGMPGPFCVWGGVKGEGGGDRGFSERKLGKGITFEM